MKLNTDLFNGRLWWEGMKRLRVLGFGVALLSMTVSALIPATILIDDLMTKYRYVWDQSVRTVNTGTHCIPLAFLPWLMPIFVLVMFSFLFKRKESDFYHSIPYTRTCIYTTYTAAVLTWVWGITALCALVSGILWAVNPYVIFSVGTLVRWTVASGLASTLLCAIMVLAVSLCGNLATALLNFFVFSVLPRTACFLIGLLLDDVTRSKLIDLHSFMGGFFTLKWFLPISIIEFAKVELGIGADFYDTSVYVYTAVVSVLLLIGACICYQRRKSETAGNSAPNVKMQHAFRIIFSLPIALIAVTMCVAGEFMLTCIIAVVLLLVYYLYELITTKQIKRLWKATPYLGVLLACCLVFLGIYHAIRAAVLYWEIEPEDIQAVELVDSCYGFDRRINYFHFEDDGMFPLKSEDPILIGVAADMLKNTQEMQRKDPHYYSQREIKLYLKNGLVITRYVREENGALRDWFANHYPAFREKALAFPSYDDVNSVSIWELYYEEPVGLVYAENALFGSEKEMELEKDFVSLLQKEYLLLTEEERYRVRFDSQLEQAPNVILITLNCYTKTEGREKFFLSVSPELLPEAHAWLTDYLQAREINSD